MKMNKQELIKRIDKLPYSEGPIADTVTVNRDWILKSIEQLDELQKVTIPQFVAEWIDTVKNKQKKDFRFNNEVIHSDDVYRVMFGILREDASTQEVKNWVVDNADTFSRAWILGYTVEKEKRYLVNVKNVRTRQGTLNRSKRSGAFIFSNPEENNLYGTKFTRTELEQAGFGWVFDCEGIEIEEVE